MKFNCPLCDCIDTALYFEHKKGKLKFNYYHCKSCSMVFMQRDALLKPSDESSRYLMHKNDVLNSGYEKFLRELINPVLDQITKKDFGLDYGSGPYPMLAQIVKSDGYQIDIYDPFFARDESKLSKKYDYITCCEVVEHFHYPLVEFKKLNSLLKEGGLLAIRTNIFYPDIDFESWFYKEDETHVVFYAPKTIEWICKKFHFDLIFFEENVFMLKKN